MYLEVDGSFINSLNTVDSTVRVAAATPYDPHLDSNTVWCEHPHHTTKINASSHRVDNHIKVALADSVCISKRHKPAQWCESQAWAHVFEMVSLPCAMAVDAHNTSLTSYIVPSQMSVISMANERSIDEQCPCKQCVV